MAQAFVHLSRWEHHLAATVCLSLLMVGGCRKKDQESFANDASERPKVILLLTDDVLEPNPVDKSYEPVSYAYKYARTTASGARSRKLEDEYRERLSPIARRLISEDILPALSAQGSGDILRLRVRGHVVQTFAIGDLQGIVFEESPVHSGCSASFRHHRVINRNK
jgi:hypothetical protein